MTCDIQYMGILINFFRVSKKSENSKSSISYVIGDTPFQSFTICGDADTLVTIDKSIVYCPNQTTRCNMKSWSRIKFDQS